MNEKKPLSLYLHIPFCIRKCNYCDFCSFTGVSEAEKDRYVARLCEELEKASEGCREHRVTTVYFGGGTPTLLSTDAIARLLRAVQQCYDLSFDAEITAECNPGTVDLAYLSALRRIGVNRLSVGLQSSNAGELRLLGRIHTKEDFLRCARDARKAGFDNFSVDVMFGIPEQTRDSFCDTLRVALSVAPTHVSAYGLKLEAGTLFGQNSERLSLPDEDAEDEMYRDAVQILSEAGLHRYEISNFARSGYESRHNLAYWTQQEYLGFGVAAHSYFCGERFGASRDFGAFLCGEEMTEMREKVSFEETMREFLMLRMRLDCGVSRTLFDERYGDGAFERLYGEGLRQYIRSGFVRETEDGYAFTTKGFRVSNYILSDLL